MENSENGYIIIQASTPNIMFLCTFFHSDDTCNLGDALKCVTVVVPMHCDVAFFPILTITAMIQITLAMLSNV